MGDTDQPKGGSWLKGCFVGAHHGYAALNRTEGEYVHQHRRSDPHPDPAHSLRLLSFGPPGPNLGRVTPQDIDTERLLRGRLAELQARIADLAKAPEPGAGIGFGKRIGDGTNEAISRRNEIGVGNSLLVTEEKLERALAKLEEGSYGRCDSCGGPIASGRLEVAPESALCIDCAR
jgi:DnaK suppressor protein